MTQLSIEDVCPKKDIYPMIVNFQNGCLTDQFTVQECLAFENGENKRKTIATVIDKLTYAGEEISEPSSKTFILVRNKKTGKVRLIESGVIDMKPIFIHNVNNTQVALESSTLELSRKFGSKKNKQYMEQREKLKVNVETVNEQMQKVTETVTKEELDLTVYENINSDDFYIPLINRAATNAADVYKLDSILREPQYEKIQAELEGKDYMSDMNPLIKEIVESKKLSSKLLVLAVYANCLIQMYHAVVKKISLKGFVICPHSVTLNEIVLNNFCSVVNGKRSRPLPYKDKTLCHAIVLILLINGMKVDLSTLCAGFKISDKVATGKLKITGASITFSGSKKIAQLKLPLSVQAPLRRKSVKF